MNLNYGFLILFLLSLSYSSCIKSSKHESGVAWSLAEYRFKHLKDIKYELFFSIPEDKEEHINSSLKIRFNYSGKKDLFIDFKEEEDHLQSISVNGSSCEIFFENEHIRIPKNLLKDDNKIEIDFIAGDLSLNRNEDYIYTLFVPARARTSFPLFDQPNLKARYRLRLEIPESWEAMSNGKILSENLNANRKTIVFKETAPISSYLFSFTAGEFQKATNALGDMNMFYRESDEEKVQRNISEIFDLHRQSLDWLEEYTGIKYPFEKFDFALIPTFQYGGMEHPGNIFYRESSLFLDEDPSINRQLSRASLIAHETAHMWFGDLVTMNWFDDVWLKEVFANFYAAKIVNPEFPEVNHELRFLMAHYPRAYSVDRTPGTHPIQQKLLNLENAGSLYGAIIYQKAPIVMRNLENYLGKDNFQKGIREYLNTYSFANATWDDLIQILQKYTEQDLKTWNEDWIKSGGRPEISVKDLGDKISYQLVNGERNNWPQNFSTAIDTVIFDVDMSIRFEHVKPKGQIIPNSDGVGYGYFSLDSLILDELFLDFSLQDEVTRASIWIMAWEAVLADDLDAKEFLSLLKDGISSEYNSLIISYQLAALERIFWNYLDDEERLNEAPELEALLFERMMKTADLSLKRNFYNSFKNIALSEDGVKKLYQIWAEELTGFNLTLSENQKISLCFELALREVENVQEIITEQLSNTNNEDNRKRMAFILPALSASESVRDSVFESLLSESNREQEPWVLNSLSYLHHPLRRASSIKYLKESLEVIEEIKRTGDIFFPYGWLSSSFGNHNSEEALNIVNQFLLENPGLAEDLKNKILQATAYLKRVIEAQY